MTSTTDSSPEVLHQHAATGTVLKRIQTRQGTQLLIEVRSSASLKALHQHGIEVLNRHHRHLPHPALLPRRSLTLTRNRIKWTSGVLPHSALIGQQILSQSISVQDYARSALGLLEAVEKGHDHGLMHGQIDLGFLVLVPGVQLFLMGMGLPLVAYPEVGSPQASKLRDLQQLSHVLQLLAPTNTPAGVLSALAGMRTPNRALQLKNLQQVRSLLTALTRENLPEVAIDLGRLPRDVSLSEAYAELNGEKWARFNPKAADERVELYTQNLHFTLRCEDTIRWKCMAVRKEGPRKTDWKELRKVDFLLSVRAKTNPLKAMLSTPNPKGKTPDFRALTERWAGYGRALKIQELEREHYEHNLKVKVTGTLREVKPGIAHLTVRTLRHPVTQQQLDLSTWLDQVEVTGFQLKVDGKRIGTVHDVTDKHLILKITSSEFKDGEVTGELHDAGTEAILDRADRALRNLRFGDGVNPELLEALLDPQSVHVPDGGPVEHLVQALVPEDTVKKQVGRIVNGQPILYLIQGPPGTGKTTTIAEVIFQEILRNPDIRILVTSQTRAAVSNVIDRLHDAIKEGLVPAFTLHRDDRDLAFSQEFDAWGSAVQQESERFGLEALQEWRQSVKSREVETDFIHHANVIGCTLMRLPQILSRLGVGEHFDLVIVDEAAKANLAELLMALLVGERAVLVGDHLQLPPHLESRTLDQLRALGFREQEIKRTLFQELFDGIPEEDRPPLEEGLKHRLTVQYRMHDSIARLVSQAYYQGELETGVLADRSLPVPEIGEGRLRWANVIGKPVKQGTSWRNDQQAEAARTVLLNLDRELRSAGVKEKLDVAVICTYRVQNMLVRRMLQGLRFTHLNVGVEAVNTVDAFQGQERDIVLHVSSRPFTRSFFASDPQRLNVAFSRAKRLLVLVGDQTASLMHPQLKPHRDFFEPLPERYLEDHHATPAHTTPDLQPTSENPVPDVEGTGGSDHPGTPEPSSPRSANRRKHRPKKQRAGAESPGDPTE